ncbi:MAG: hypothetical protein ACFCBW_15520 [Candidatus Competibacterales bacterium]
MVRLTRPTLEHLIQQLAAHPFGAEDIQELVAPQQGVITGFQDLLEDLEALRQLDLGTTGPARGVRSGRPEP